LNSLSSKHRPRSLFYPSGDTNRLWIVQLSCSGRVAAVERPGHLSRNNNLPTRLRSHYSAEHRRFSLCVRGFIGACLRGLAVPGRGLRSRRAVASRCVALRVYTQRAINRRRAPMLSHRHAALTTDRHAGRGASPRSSHYAAVRTTERSRAAVKGNGGPYSTAERRVPELIPVLGSQPAGDVSHKPGDRLPLLSARPAVTRATLKRAATNFAAW